MSDIYLPPDPPVLVSIAAIRRIACPVDTPPWIDAHHLTIEDVEEACAKGDLMDTPLGAAHAPVAHHAARIAYLIEMGWSDPIEIDVGVPFAKGWQHRWPIADGNHRLYAAILREDTDILAEICGCIETANGMFGLEAA